ncbi:MAG: hypothetical protein U9N55_07345, partial [candidate division Zixibacteria bacterium]|nr:hypothetical protein [candidate division Zixibacteria bacterium]
WPFGKRNYIVFAIAFVTIILGYITLGQGSITLAPVLLVIGYCILIPIALIIKDPSIKEKTTEEDNQQLADV